MATLALLNTFNYKFWHKQQVPCSKPSEYPQAVIISGDTRSGMKTVFAAWNGGRISFICPPELLFPVSIANPSSVEMWRNLYLNGFDGRDYRILVQSDNA